MSADGEVPCPGCRKYVDEDDLRRDQQCDEPRCPDCIAWGQEMIEASVRDAMEDMW